MLTNIAIEWTHVLMTSDTNVGDTFPHALYHLKYP